LGHLGWSEREYFESSPESVYYAVQGYFDKRKDDAMLLRNIAWINYKVNGGKGNNIEKLWPLNKKEEAQVKTWGDDKELLEKIMEAHKIKLNV
jgi:hypothetical protein